MTIFFTRISKKNLVLCWTNPNTNSRFLKRVSSSNSSLRPSQILCSSASFHAVSFFSNNLNFFIILMVTVIFCAISMKRLFFSIAGLMQRLGRYQKSVQYAWLAATKPSAKVIEAKACSRDEDQQQKGNIQSRIHYSPLHMVTVLDVNQSHPTYQRKPHFSQQSYSSTVAIMNN